MMRWTRRRFAGLPLLGVFGGRVPGGRRARVERIRLTSGAPWRELEAAWRGLGFGSPGRVVARAAAAWWPHGRELPDRWAAWVEFGDGRVLVAECRPRERIREAGPRAGFRGGEAVAEALRGQRGA